MRHLSLLSLIALSVASVSVGCAAATPEEESAVSESGLVNAPVDTKNTWAVGVCASAPNTDPALGPIGACVTAGTRCTGSLIAANLVLTARHCVEEIDYSNATGFCAGAKFVPRANPSFHVTLDLSVLGENVSWRDVAEVLTEGAEDNGCKNDIAILRLAQPVTPADAKPIAVDTRPLAKTHPKAIAVVGRGVLTDLMDLSTGTPLEREANGGLKRRFMTDIPWQCVSNNPARPCVVDDYSSPPTNEFTLPTDAYFAFGDGTASGDSGSALLGSAKFKSGKPIAVGVLSAGTYDKNGVGNHGLGVRLDAHEAWIESTLVTKASGPYTLVTRKSGKDSATE